MALHRATTMVVLTFCLALPACAEEPGIGDSVVVQRADGSRVSGVLQELTDDLVVIRLKYGSVKIDRGEVASLEATEKPAVPVSSATPDEIAEAVEAVLDLLAERETVEASEKIHALLEEHAGNSFLDDRAAQRVMLEEIRTAELHEDVVDLESLADYLALMAELACPDCGGPGEKRCRTCRGKGQSACVECKGKGLIKCSDCRGKGKLTCPKCRGTARMDCDDCGPNDGVCCSTHLAPKLGLLRRFRNGDNAPIRNDGRGKRIYVDCPECTNSGKDTCDTCDAGPTGLASGFNVCRNCSGDKRLQCRACGGSRLADVCAGCGGAKSSRCESCAGTGQRPPEPAGEDE